MAYDPSSTVPTEELIPRMLDGVGYAMKNNPPGPAVDAAIGFFVFAAFLGLAFVIASQLSKK